MPTREFDHHDQFLFQRPFSTYSPLTNNFDERLAEVFLIELFPCPHCSLSHLTWALEAGGGGDMTAPDNNFIYRFWDLCEIIHSGISARSFSNLNIKTGYFFVVRPPVAVSFIMA